MPLIYGEGGVDAFIRLQKAIMEKSDDHSLFAWRQEDGPAGHGLLATSPALFAKSQNIIPTIGYGLKSAYSMTNRGLEIQLFVTCTLRGGDFFALLDCKEAAKSVLLGIFIAPTKDGRFVRVQLNQLYENLIQSIFYYHRKPIRAIIYIPQLLLPEEPPQPVIRFGAERDETNFKSHPEPSRLLKSVSSVLPSSVSLVPETTVETYTPIFTTKPGRTDDLLDSLNFELMMGGRAGVLLIPSYALSLSTSAPLEVRRAIVIVFGVNIDKSVYVHVARFGPQHSVPMTRKKISHTQSRPTPLALHETQTATWFDLYIEQLSVDSDNSDKRKSEMEVYNLLFSVEVRQVVNVPEKRYQGRYRVIISYTSNGDK